MKGVIGNEKLKKLMEKYHGNISVLEEQIDVKLQMEYFKESREQKSQLVKEEVLNRKDEIFSDELVLNEKKKLLCQLALVDEVEAFKALERYRKLPDEQLLSWSVLAYQQSKMLMQSTLLDEKPLFISTGLGGQGKMLRYFIVIITKDYANFVDYQKKLVRNEFETTFKKSESVLEEMTCEGNYLTVTGLVSLEVGLKKMISQIIAQCNEIGDFLNTSVLVTNVKKLSSLEIQAMIEEQKNNSIDK